MQGSERHRYGSINEDLEEDENWFYFFGLIMSDGTYSKEDRVEIELVEYDVQLLKDLAVWLDYKPQIRFYSNRRTTRKRAKLGFTSKIYNKKFENMGLAHRKQTRERYKNIPDQYFIDFFRGYFDGDGNVSDGRIRIYSGWDILYQINSDTERLYGIKGVISSVSSSSKVGGLVFDVISSKKLSYYMYNHNGICLDRKRKRLFEWYRWNDIGNVSEEEMDYGRRRVNGERGSKHYF